MSCPSLQVSTERGSKGHCVVPIYDLVVMMTADSSGRASRTYVEPLVCDGLPVIADGKPVHVQFTVIAHGHSTAAGNDRSDRPLSMSLPPGVLAAMFSDPDGGSEGD